MNELKLLYVEDDAEALDDIVYLLRNTFYDICIATDGLMALEVYKSEQPDILLLDINIPKINGLKVANEIRKINKTIPIIFLTAHSQTHKLQQAIEIKATSYLIKPFKIKELKDTIQKAINEVIPKDNTIKLTNDFLWDKNANELYFNDIKIVLTKNEIQLIKILILNRSRFLNAQDLSSDIFINDDNMTGNNIVQIISRFKKKVQKQIDNDKFFIESIYGEGYRIT